MSASKAEQLDIFDDQLGYAYDLCEPRKVAFRFVTRRSGIRIKSKVRLTSPLLGRQDRLSAVDSYDLAWLQEPNRPITAPSSERIGVADLFSGCGGLSAGLAEACRALSIGVDLRLVIDNDPDALMIFGKNFSPAHSLCADVTQIFNGKLGEAPTAIEAKLLGQIGQIDLLVAGPPCQGHSDLNNHTRRRDVRNKLILVVARFAELTRPKHVIIENVQGSRHDQTGSVAETCAHLTRLGYCVSSGLMQATQIGIPQNRRRFFVVASRHHFVSFADIVRRHKLPERSFGWACRDLSVNENSTFDSSARHSPTNQARIDYLHSQDLYELPNHKRPDCHRLKNHSYDSVYGRLRGDRPAPTITTGFGSTGQGRFVHPHEPRTITPHEAARLQFFPDFFSFQGIGRRRLQKLIGNAVPPRMAYVIALELLR